MKINPNILLFEYSNGACLYNKNNGKEYIIGKNELIVLKHICNEQSQTNPPTYITANQYSAIVKMLMQKEIIFYGDSYIESKKKAINNGYLKLLGYNILSKIYMPSLLYRLFCILPIIFTLLLIIFHRRFDISGIANIKSTERVFSMVIGGYFFSLISLCGHEIAHAVVAQKKGCYVVEMGFMLMLIIPCAYVKIVGMEMCKKADRLKILLAGVYFNFSFTLLSAILICLLPASPSMQIILLTNIIDNIFITVLNSLCFLKFDGQRILCVLFNENPLKWGISFLKTSSSTQKINFTIFLFMHIVVCSFGILLRSIVLLMIIDIIYMLLLCLKGKSVNYFCWTLSISHIICVIPFVFNLLLSGSHYFLLYSIIYLIFTQAVIPYLGILCSYINHIIRR